MAEQKDTIKRSLIEKPTVAGLPQVGHKTHNTQLYPTRKEII